MQRTEPDGVVILCDFCHRDWDGEEPMMEGHHGSIICLACLQHALKEKSPAPAPYRCNLCLQENLQTPRWSHPDHPDDIACQDCLYQAAGTFSKSPLTDWTWDRLH